MSALQMAREVRRVVARIRVLARRMHGRFVVHSRKLDVFVAAQFSPASRRRRRSSASSPIAARAKSATAPATAPSAIPIPIPTQIIGAVPSRSR